MSRPKPALSMLQKIEKRARDRGLTSSAWLEEAFAIDEFREAVRRREIPEGTTFEVFKLARLYGIPLTELERLTGSDKT